MPRDIPSPEQICKLPKWAQDYIKDLDRQRYESKKTLDEVLDKQTHTEYSTQDFLCDESPPRHVTVYFTAPHGITAVFGELEVNMRVSDRAGGIEISYSNNNSLRVAAFMPTAFGRLLVFATDRPDDLTHRTTMPQRGVPKQGTNNDQDQADPES